MHNLPCPQELDSVVHIRVIGEAEDIVVGDACLLLCCDKENTTSFWKETSLVFRLAFTDNALYQLQDFVDVDGLC